MSDGLIQVFDADFGKGDKVHLLRHTASAWAPREEFSTVATIEVEPGSEAVAFSGYDTDGDVIIAVERRKPVIQIALEWSAAESLGVADHDHARFSAYGREWSVWEDYSDGPETIPEDVSFLLRVKP